MVTARSSLLTLVLGLTTVGCGERSSRSDTQPRLDVRARVITLVPVEDRERSPYTGWTRAHYEAVFARMVLGFVDHRSPAGARTHYPGGEELPASMEGAIRMLPALGAWLACSCNPDRVIVGDRELDIVEIARAIVVAGTDPSNADYWRKSRGGWDQREVEASTVAEFLVRSRARVWDRLTVLEQALIMRWLEPAQDPLAANWLAFQIARNSARGVLGRSVPKDALREQLDRLERDYVGDGFYRDGHIHRFDWYNAFVIHPELSFWRSTLAQAEQAEQARAIRVARRTQAFLAHLPYLFDAEGRVAPLGRSLAYRSGVLAGIHASVLAGDEFLDPGLARRMSAGNLGFHARAGMFADDEVLTLGYHGDQAGVLEDYLRPGSQYFATRGLSVLALPPEHPFWTAKEQPLPADLGDFVHVIPAIGWAIHHDADGAGLVLQSAGSGSNQKQHHDKYAKLGYPAQTWFAQADEGGHPYDAAIVSASKGEFSKRRSVPDARAVAPGFAWLRYAIAPESGGDAPHRIAAATLSDPAWTGAASLRLSCVTPSSAEPARAYAGSYAIALGPEPRSLGDQRGPWFYVDSGGSAPDWGAGAVLLAGLAGWSRADRELDYPAPAEHVLGGRAGFVGLGVDGAFAGLRCFASMEALAGERFDPSPLLAAAPQVSFRGSRARIGGYGPSEAWIELADHPAERIVELGPLRASGPLRLLWTGAHGSGRRLVAVGLRELADEAGPLLESSEGVRAIVACDWSETQLRCQVDGPIRVRRPDPGALELRTREAVWTGAEPRWVTRRTIPAWDGAGDVQAGWITVPVELGEVGSVIVEIG